MKNIIISGAGGFLGGYLLKEIAGNMEYKVTALTTHPEKLVNKYPNIMISDNYQNVDFSLFDVLINLAYPRTTSDGYSIGSGLDFVFNLLGMAIHDGVGAIINVSSQSVYDPKRKRPAVESDPVCPIDVYAVGKYCVELFLREHAGNIPYTNLRMASLIGPDFDDRVPNKMIKKALNGEDIHVLSGDQKYGYLDVRDAAKALAVVIASDTSIWKSIYNVGSNEAYSLYAIAHNIYKLLGSNNEIVYDNGIHNINTAINIDLFEASFYNKDVFSLSETLKSIIEKYTSINCEDNNETCEK